MRVLLAVAFLPYVATAQAPPPLPAEVTRTGAFQDPLLLESSGVVRSRVMEAVLFTINDSGNDPIVFAFDSTGLPLGRWPIPGTRDRDWEALAIGPCPVGSCIYIGDIGDNREQQRSVTIYRVREPVRLNHFVGAADTTPLDLDSLVFSYPDGAHDSEAMWVDQTGAVFVVTKGRTGGVKLFRLAATAFKAGAAVAELVQPLPIMPNRGLGGWVTDAALSPNGHRVAIRTYAEVYFFSVLPMGQLADPVVCSIAGLEAQGEGIAWLDDRRLVLTSEAVGTHWPGTIHIMRICA
jgi:hypothetical protein